MRLAALLIVLSGCTWATATFTNHGPPVYTYGPDDTENQNVFPSRAAPDAGTFMDHWPTQPTPRAF